MKVLLELFLNGEWKDFPLDTDTNFIWRCPAGHAISFRAHLVAFSTLNKDSDAGEIACDNPNCTIRIPYKLSKSLG